RPRPLQGLRLVCGSGAQPGAVRPPQTDIAPTGASRIATAIRSTRRLACRCTLTESAVSCRYPSAKCHLAPSDQTRSRAFHRLECRAGTDRRSRRRSGLAASANETGHTPKPNRPFLNGDCTRIEPLLAVGFDL